MLPNNQVLQCEEVLRAGVTAEVSSSELKMKLKFQPRMWVQSTNQWVLTTVL